MVKATLGKKLSMLRSLKGWSQAEAAEVSGLSVRYFQSLERGEKWPSDLTLEKIKKGFQLQDIDLLGSPDSPALAAIIEKMNELKDALNVLVSEKEPRSSEEDDLIRLIGRLGAGEIRIITKQARHFLGLDKSKAPSTFRRTK